MRVFIIWVSQVHLHSIRHQLQLFKTVLIACDIFINTFLLEQSLIEVLIVSNASRSKCCLLLGKWILTAKRICLVLNVLVLFLIWRAVYTITIHPWLLSLRFSRWKREVSHSFGCLLLDLLRDLGRRQVGILFIVDRLPLRRWQWRHRWLLDIVHLDL